MKKKYLLISVLSMAIFIPSTSFAVECKDNESQKECIQIPESNETKKLDQEKTAEPSRPYRHTGNLDNRF